MTTTTTTTTVAALIDAKVQTLIEKNLTLLVEPVQHLGAVLGMDTALSETSAAFLTHLLGSDFTAQEGLASLIHDVQAGQEARLTALEDAVDAIMAHALICVAEQVEIGLARRFRVTPPCADAGR